MSAAKVNLVVSRISPASSALRPASRRAPTSRRVHNPHRIFGGPYSLTGVDEVNLFSQDRRDSGDPRLHFTDVVGCNDTRSGAFAVDNLKFWSYDKTDYTDRFKEGF